jgi:hypothetical protein
MQSMCPYIDKSHLKVTYLDKLPEQLKCRRWRCFPNCFFQQFPQTQSETKNPYLEVFYNHRRYRLMRSWIM